MIDLGYTPRQHQREAHALRLLVRFIVLVWHRRAGKTVFAIMELVLAALACRLVRGRYAYIAPFYKQGKAVAWPYLRAFSVKVPGAVVNESELSVEFPNGAQVRLFGADNPDSLRGLYFDGVVMDEVADMRAQVWGEIIRPALTDRLGWAIFIGTPKGTNLFSERYFAALTDPEWRADLRRASDTGVIPADELERARREMSPPQFAQEFDCDFAAAVQNILIPLQHAIDATQRVLDTREYRQDSRILGVDVARYGDDRSVAFLRQGRKAYPPVTWRGLDLMTLAGNIARMMDEEQPNAVFIDQTGIGSGVVDRLLQLGKRVIGVDFSGKEFDDPGQSVRFQNRRAQMWWLMADWVKTAQLPPVQALLSELTAPTYTYANAAGKLQLESKEDMKERGLPSPDLADALALTFAEPVASPGLGSLTSRHRVLRAVGAGR